MITRCPACQTHFRVHAEQLAARAGQVRCGKCGKVFDALEHLSEEPVAARAPQPETEFPSESLPAPAAAEAPLDQAAEAVVRPQGTFEEIPASAAPEQPAEAAHEEQPYEAAEGAASEPAPSGLSDADADEQQAPNSLWGVEIPLAEKLARAGAPGFFAGASAASARDFEFGPQAKAARRRWPWLLGAILLLLVLCGQIAYRYRSGMVVLFPDIKPYAAAICARFGCELPLPRRIELLSIEASDLQADTTNPNVMVLSATLKNRAVFSQQLPMLELTLTDAQDQPLVRRVLAPQDYLGKRFNVQDGFPASGELPLRAFIEASKVKAVGYRLYLFYP